MMVKYSLKVRWNLSLISKLFFFISFLFFSSNAYTESYVKAGESLIWDSENKSYTANGDVEFKNDKFVAFADKMIANYIEENNDEILLEIISCDINGSTASVKVRDGYLGMIFVDTLSLLKVNDDWKIYTKLFHVES